MFAIKFLWILWIKRIHSKPTKACVLQSFAYRMGFCIMVLYPSVKDGLLSKWMEDLRYVVLSLIYWYIKINKRMKLIITPIIIGTILINNSCPVVIVVVVKILYKIIIGKAPRNTIVKMIIWNVYLNINISNIKSTI